MVKQYLYLASRESVSCHRDGLASRPTAEPLDASPGDARWAAYCERAKPGSQLRQLVLRMEIGDPIEVATSVADPERSAVCPWNSVSPGSADAPARGRPGLRIPVFTASRRGLIVGAVATSSGVGLRGSVQPGRQSLAESTRRVDTCLRSQSLRAAASCPTGKLAGALRFSKRRQLNNPHARVLARQELLLRAGDVSLPVRSPHERRLLELAASSESNAVIGREVGVRHSPRARVDQRMVGETVAGQRYAPRRPGPCTRRRAQNRGRT